MPHKKKGKTWRKEPVNINDAPEVLNVRCCCTPKKILGFIPLEFAKNYILKYFGDDKEIAVYGDGNDLSYWNRQEGFVGA